MHPNAVQQIIQGYLLSGEIKAGETINQSYNGLWIGGNDNDQ
ncbi:hypothetical protein [Oceanobacillus neutriphilus]|uniref:Uncharacterized protein n=1 Tax=Oceanobacillus neutriphilus TaxID=531815 RepID=A0ABQ2NWZ7_9BACI|nr:hypothetical protein [Oceanobacillus neutriphilus]GGP12638.1 hypothetical protein GCM10011346_29400 [Oceanobacillus neutriphilus]